MANLFVNKIFDAEYLFNKKLRAVFEHQLKYNQVYKEWCGLLNRQTFIQEQQVPFLPISFFKTHKVVTGNKTADCVFESSSTTGSGISKHFINDVSVYEQSFLRAFQLFYGNVKEWCIIGLLPSYLERKNSSLVYMVNKLIELSAHKQSGFYLHDYEKLHQTLTGLELSAQKTILICVSFALLDFAERYTMQLQHTVVIETGGMKGRNREITRQEFQAIIKQKLGVKVVHAEYGMTELLSQAYSKGNGLFYCPYWMKVMVRDEENPLSVASSGKGVLNIVDLANINSCSFIATDDVGIVYDDGSFEVAGRLDNSDIRGCSLLVI